MMPFQFSRWKCYPAIILLCLLWSSEGLTLAASYATTTERETEMKRSDSIASASYKTLWLEPSESGALSLPTSSLATQSLQLLSTSLSSFSSVDVTDSLTNSEYMFSSTQKTENTLPSPTISSVLTYSIMNSSSSLPYHSDSYPPPGAILPSSASNSANNSDESDSVLGSYPVEVFSSKSETVDTSDTFFHFHTPLMSLLVASPSSSLSAVVPTQTTSHQINIPAQSLTTSSSDNESTNPNHLPVPTDQDHKKLLMLVLRAEDCTRFSKSDFEKMLSKLMAKFGFNDVIPEVSNAKCYSHLNINVTVGGPTPTLRFLPNMDGKNNYTVDVLNRTFRIVKLEKVDLRLEKTKSSNASSNIIAAVAKHESVAYIAVGVSFGLILVICVSVCCIKCCCLRKPAKRYGVPKGTHVRLRPEDYTLTPIPRPTSLYVDYYRGSVTADIYSTTSAGSIASTTPTVEQGVVQPFDTSIVPLEDSSNLPLDSSRDPSVESVPVQSDLKTFNIHSLSGKGFRAVSTDSKEQLNPKAHSRKVEIKPSGVANPTFQRY